MNHAIRYHILGKTYKKGVNRDLKKVSGTGTAHKKDYDNADMLENVISNIEKMKFEDRKESPKIRTVSKTVGGSVNRKRSMPLKFKFTI